jgi:hypothetical protein
MNIFRGVSVTFPDSEIFLLQAILWSLTLAITASCPTVILQLEQSRKRAAMRCSALLGCANPSSEHAAGPKRFISDIGPSASNRSPW